MASSSFLIAEELFERGDPSFVNVLRQSTDADRLGAFAAKWIADRRPVAREFLFEYLDRPLNAYRHEAMVKRLFKLAEKAGDNELMARFLVLFDRSVRRTKKKVTNYKSQTVDDKDLAQSMVDEWSSQGVESVRMSDSGGRYLVWANWAQRVRRWEREFVPTEAEARVLAARWRSEGALQPTIQDTGGRYTISGIWRGEKVRARSNTVMPRGRKISGVIDPRTGKEMEVPDLYRSGWKPSGDNPSEQVRARLEKSRLFSIHTRNYLRRRAWRYFRNLGRKHPDRYVPAVSIALKRYADWDVNDGLALLDNWGLIHILFHDSPVLVAKTNAWMLAPDRSLSELKPAPFLESLWRGWPRTLLDLIRDAKARPVRQWAVRLIQEDPKKYLAHLEIEELLGLLSHSDEEVVELGAELLRGAPGLETLTLERWLSLMHSSSPGAIEAVCALMAKHVDANQMTFEQIVQTASARPLPMAKLGLSWLQSREPATEAECRALLNLAEAQCEAVRPDLVFWAWGALSSSPHFNADWVLEFLDSRHLDVRREGWTWLQNESRARDDVEVWRKLLESPYDDVRLRLVSELETRVEKTKYVGEKLPLDPEMVRFLWASVLLNIHRGGKTKPVVVNQLLRRLERHSAEASHLLPILGTALRSVRGPEWRAGLAGVVQAVERNPEIGPLVEKSFPELRLTQAVTG